MFEYEFMRRAFLVGILLASIIPCIGVTIVLKRLSMIGDALSHTSLAGVAMGLILGINPILGAVIVTVFSGFAIDLIRKKYPKYSEISIAIIMSAGVGLAGILSGFADNSSGFTSFLFGSIVAITDFELYLVIGLSLLVMLTFLLLYKELMYISFDESGARLAGVPVKYVNFVFTILTALTVSIASRTVGALIVSSIMVIPVACAMRFSSSYRMTVILSIVFAVIFTIIGLTLSFYLGLKPGGTIVIASVITLIVSMLIKK
ncbi:metal ABC transporter permease [Peptostreptococcus canis]|uniref:Metal ABC transporter permease n=1 Tax=Peptostreptococcus canis TaxID=1159213 RepID=A0ABR6TN46_9FIRM|nr:metal ABC transporter permease [Peptostreptococcus canis]MBC2576839.1 metal ABC transporter permease [Peptostreptococcus canis]MBP1998940.1 zinc transport system permease protein [Peptostreptococcus canis]